MNQSSIPSVTKQVLCQSATLPMRLNLPCQNRASEVLYGVYLCASHGHAWRRRLKAGEKIRLHPQRIWSHQGLPLSEDGPALPPLSEPVANVAEPTGSAVPAAAYAGAAGHPASPPPAGAVDRRGLPVVPAGVRDIPDAASGHSSEAPALSLPPNEPGAYPPTYCFRSYCICCGRGSEYFTRQRKPLQAATRCAHCNGRMIVEFEKWGAA